MASDSGTSVEPTSAPDAFGDDLRQSRTWLRLALDAATMGAWDQDLTTGAIVRAIRLAELFGFDPEARPTLDEIRSRYHPDDRDRVITRTAEAIAGQERAIQDEFRVVLPDGRIRWVARRGEILRDAGGKAVRTVGVVMDITEAKLAEEAAAEAERRLTAAMKTGRLGSWELDLRTGGMHGTATCKASLGLPPEAQLTAATLVDLVHPDDREAVRAALQHCAERGEDCDAEYRVVWADGSVHWLLMRGHVIAAPTGEPQRVVGFTISITKWKTAEERQRIARERKELMLREVSHRVKNNLQMIVSLLNMQAARMDDAEARRQFDQACRRIATVADIHTALYENSDVADDRLSVLEFGDYLRTLCRNLAASFVDDGGRVTIAVAADRAELPMELALPLGLIATELVTNSLKYAFPAAATGQVDVTFERRPDGGLRLAVSDDGCGLPPDADQASSGLGLRLVRALAGQIDGGIALDGGPGLRVTIDVPPR